MKKILSILSIAAFAAVYSCSTDVNENIEPTRPTDAEKLLTEFVVTADEGSATRADFGTITASTAPVVFEAGDEIKIRTTDVPSGVTFSTAAGGATAVFDRKAGEANNIAYTDGTVLYAAYPASLGQALLSPFFNKFTVTFPSVITDGHGVGCLPKASALMTGNTTVTEGNTAIALKHACGLWLLQLKGSAAGQILKKVSLTVNNEQIAGAFIADFGDAPTMAYSAAGSNTITYSGLNEALSTTDATQIYFALPPKTYSNFFLVYIEVEDGAGNTKCMLETSSKSTVITRAQITRSPILTFAPSEPFAGGTGTQADPYQIATVDQWTTFATFVNSGNKNFSGEYVKLTSDLDFGGKTFAQVGTKNYYGFLGTFDGNDKTIKNVTHSTASYPGGLFAFLNGTVKNLKVDKCNITSTYSANRDSHSAILCGGYNAYTKWIIKDCTITDSSITATGNNYVGGICAQQNGDITRCAVVASRINGGSKMGAIAGETSASNNTISDCLSKGNTITASSQWVGGIVGKSTKTTVNCVSTGNTITGTQYVGGIAGLLSNSAMTAIFNSLSDGNILQGTTRIGGIVGNMEGVNVKIVNCFSKDCSITSSYDNAQYGSYLGLLAGQIDNAAAVVKNCYVRSGTITRAGGNGNIGIVSGNTLTFTNVSGNYYYTTGTLKGFGVTGSLTGSDITAAAESKTLAYCTDGSLLSTLNTGVGTLKTTYSALVDWVAGADSWPTFAHEATVLGYADR